MTTIDPQPSPERLPYTPELVRVGYGWNSHWLVSYESGMDPDDYHAGWADVWSNARTGLVEVCHLDSGDELTPVEARNLAHALLAAADHAEQHRFLVAEVLRSEQNDGWIDQQGLSLDTVRAINEWINTRVRRAFQAGNKP